MCHRHQIMMTFIGRRLPIGHSIHLNYHQKYHGSEETTNAPQSRHNGMEKQCSQWDGYSTCTSLFQTEIHITSLLRM